MSSAVYAYQLLNDPTVIGKVAGGTHLGIVRICGVEPYANVDGWVVIAGRYENGGRDETVYSFPMPGRTLLVIYAAPIEDGTDG